MSTATALGVGYASAVVALLTAIWRVGPKRRRLSEDERVAAARKRVGLIPAARDNRPGLDAEALDFIELTYGMPAYIGPELEAGCQRLWAEVRDEQQNGDQK